MSFDIADEGIEATINDPSGQEIFNELLSVFESGIIGDVSGGVVTLLLGGEFFVNSGECRELNFYLLTSLHSDARLSFNASTTKFVSFSSSFSCSS